MQRLSFDDLAASAGGWHCSVRFVQGHPVFEGHFPGRPILPGVAQLALLADFLESCLGPGCTIRAIHKVRFRQVVQPGDRLRVDVSKPQSDGRLSFKLSRDGTIVAGGLLSVDVGARSNG